MPRDAKGSDGATICPLPLPAAACCGIGPPSGDDDQKPSDACGASKPPKPSKGPSASRDWAWGAGESRPNKSSSPAALAFALGPGPAQNESPSRLGSWDAGSWDGAVEWTGAVASPPKRSTRPACDEEPISCAPLPLPPQARCSLFSRAAAALSVSAWISDVKCAFCLASSLISVSVCPSSRRKRSRRDSAALSPRAASSSRRLSLATSAAT
mmetsp:Transcript_12097/g.40127  ORF Transcript_12097/g.40127 Transcript_12097/m.40127 type:complete len:212 (-) Transcript_12097:289-924(-)